MNGDLALPLSIVLADIVTMEVDAIVNAANPALMGGAGTNGAIHLAAGPRLREACVKLKGCDVGDAKITPGFDLPAKWIIHTVGPIWRGGAQHEAELLKQCYEKSLALAKVHQINTIAFPAISTGIYGYPKREAATIALTALLKNHRDFQKIIACVFSPEDEALYQSVLQDLKRFWM